VWDDRPARVHPAPSGETLRIAPGEKSDAVADVEVRGSEKVGELIGRGVIAQHGDAVRRPVERRPSRRAKTRVNP